MSFVLFFSLMRPTIPIVILFLADKYVFEYPAYPAYPVILFLANEICVRLPALCASQRTLRLCGKLSS